MSLLQSSNVKAFKNDFGRKKVDHQDLDLEERRTRDLAPVIADHKAIIEAVTETHPFERSNSVPLLTSTQSLTD